MKKLFNHKTQNIKVFSHDIWNSQPRLAKNRSREAAFWTGLMTIHEFLDEREEEEGQMLGEVGEVRRDSLAEEKAALKVRPGNSKTFLFPIKNV